MATLIARNDALVVPQVSTIAVDTLANARTYTVSINTKEVSSYVSDGSATEDEIIAGLLADLEDSEIPEVAEATYDGTTDPQLLTITGQTGKPFLYVTGTGDYTITEVTTAESPNHFIAKNFSTGALPVNGDTVILDGLNSSQGFKYNLDHNTVTLAALHIRASSEAPVGLPEYNDDSTRYYQAGYRETHLKISASILVIGEGSGAGAERVKLNLGTNACVATVFSTSSNTNGESAPVHLIGSNAGNSLHVISGLVDVGMLPGTGASCSWPTVVADGGVVRFGEGATLTTVEAAGSSRVEIRSAVTTLRTRDNGLVDYLGSGNIGTLDIAGGPVTIKATGALAITQLNGYGGNVLDLTFCDSIVTLTNATIYGTPTNPFTIRDPNNKLSMTNPASTPNGAQSLVLITGSGKNIRLT